MNIAYIETSALLAWLFNEPAAEEAMDRINQADLIVTSELLKVETCRALLRAERERILSADQYKWLSRLFLEKMKGWFRMSMDSSVIERASKNFPVEPVRSLDAIHLATALEYRKLYPELRMISFNRRLTENIKALGLE